MRAADVPGQFGTPIFDRNAHKALRTRRLTSWAAFRKENKAPGYRDAADHSYQSFDFMRFVTPDGSALGRSGCEARQLTSRLLRIGRYGILVMSLATIFFNQAYRSGGPERPPFIDVRDERAR